jgi:regulator of protease activity HflC (stomatin/prohibitin superfamily)
MITGDGNLLELQGSLRYTVRNPRAYLFEVSDPDAVLRDAAEAVLRELVGSQAFAGLLTTDRERFQREALARIQVRCWALGENGLGIELEGVALHDLHPPSEVVEAYHAVTKAMETRDRKVNEATAAALRAERSALADKEQTVRRAEAAHDERLALARARLEAFRDRYRQRSELTAEDEARIAREALFDGEGVFDLPGEYLRRRSAAVRLREQLTDFRLYWDMLAAALAGRDKVIIDADKVPGRRHLWLAPEPPRVPLLVPGAPRGREEP